MITKQKLCSIALASTAMILMLMSIAGGTHCIYYEFRQQQCISNDTATNTLQPLCLLDIIL